MLFLCRSHFLGKLQTNEVIAHSPELLRDLKLLNFKQNLWVLSLALRDGNFTVTQDYLEKTKGLRNSCPEYVTSLDFIDWRNHYIESLLTFQNSKPTIEWQQMWADSWTSSKEVELTHSIDMQGKLLRALITNPGANANSNTSWDVIKNAMGINSRYSNVQVALLASV